MLYGNHFKLDFFSWFWLVAEESQSYCLCQSNHFSTLNETLITKRIFKGTRNFHFLHFFQDIESWDNYFDHIFKIFLQSGRQEFIFLMTVNYSIKIPKNNTPHVLTLAIKYQELADTFSFPFFLLFFCRESIIDRVLSKPAVLSPYLFPVWYCISQGKT